jgi:hypothetical protein
VPYKVILFHYDEPIPEETLIPRCRFVTVVRLGGSPEVRAETIVGRPVFRGKFVCFPKAPSLK